MFTRILILLIFVILLSILSFIGYGKYKKFVFKSEKLNKIMLIVGIVCTLLLIVHMFVAYSYIKIINTPEELFKRGNEKCTMIGKIPTENKFVIVYRTNWNNKVWIGSYSGFDLIAFYSLTGNEICLGEVDNDNIPIHNCEYIYDPNLYEMYLGIIQNQDKDKILVNGEVPNLVDIEVDGGMYSIWYVDNIISDGVDVTFKNGSIQDS